MTAKMPPLVPNLTQFALGFAVVSDACVCGLPGRHRTFQSALRFAVVSDVVLNIIADHMEVSIRFEVRGGFRHAEQCVAQSDAGFQSALRFAVVSDIRSEYESVLMMD